MSARARFWVETAVAACAAILAITTLFWRDWIETIFGVDPDHGNGSAEWVVVAALVAIALALGMLARSERRRLLDAEQRA